MHISDGVLRAMLDGELAEADALRTEEHLSRCPDCRKRSDEIRERAGRVQALLGPPLPLPLDTNIAFARVQARLEASAARPKWFQWRRPALAAAFSVALIALMVTSAPARAVAQKLLSFLRVKTVVAVPVENDFLGNGKAQLLRDLLSDSATVTRDEKAMPAATREEARQLAGFTPRLPTLRQDAPALKVEGERSFYVTVKKQRVQEFLDLVNRPDLVLPDQFEGANVAFDVPRAVAATYGDCPKDGGPLSNPARALSCVVLLQAPSVTVVTHPELDLRRLAEVGLQVSGMTLEQAREFSKAIDWTSTLAVPIPREAASYETVAVDGTKGILVVGRPYLNYPTRWSLIWVRDGRMYWLGGFGDPSMAVPLAESLS